MGAPMLRLLAMRILLEVPPPLDTRMKKILSIFLVLVAFGATACGQRPDGPAPATGTDADSMADAAAQLAALADDVWADQVENSTYLRLQEGLPIEKFEDLTLEHYHSDIRKTAGFRARLSEIDPSTLGSDDLITYEILKFELRDRGLTDDDYWLNFDITSYQAPYLFQFAQQALATASLHDKAEADQYLNLAEELADAVDQLNAKLAGQIERGIYLPKPALPAVRETWQGIKVTLPAGVRVAKERLESLSGEERAAFEEALEQVIADRIVSGLDDLIAAIGAEYETSAPDTVGLAQYPGGAAVYARAIETQTTLGLTPREIHDRGIQAVSEIAERMARVRKQLEFEGSARDFIEEVAFDPRFIAESPEEVESTFWEYIRRIEPKLDNYFKTQPEAAYGVRRLPPAAEPGMTYGYYNPPTAAEPVGYYNYNGSNLDNKSLLWSGHLIYHELLPGHHFHIATQAENEALHELRQKYSVAAYTEGWAEYASSLGIEMGLYEDPYDLYGRYLGEIFLAARLVVDTGMNALGWSLEEAREYMAQYVVQSEQEIASETLRYSTSIPAQALAYRLGYEKHWELRNRAEEKLGDGFDIREYHEVVLSDGAMPLPVLEAKVDRWIDSQL
jgi:uncharacterized protein (DUF885 family)